MIQWGFIGCGDVTEKKSGPAFSKVQGSKVVAVMRRDADKAKDYAQRHSIGKWYSDAEALINDPNVNAIYVATPPAQHAQYAIAAMKAGKPVYVEKPMATTYEECQKMIAISNETGIPCYVAYYRRTLPYFLRVKQLIDDGVLGKIYSINIHFAIPPYETDYNRNHLPWRVNKEIAGGGYFYDMASHQLDLLDFIFGPIKYARGKTANIAGLYDVEDRVLALFELKSNIVGMGSWYFAAPKGFRTDKIIVTGSEGKLSFSTFGFTNIKLKTSEGKKAYSEENPENIQFNLIESIVNSLNGKGGKVVSDAVSAARTNWVMEQIVG